MVEYFTLGSLCWRSSCKHSLFKDLDKNVAYLKIWTKTATEASLWTSSLRATSGEVIVISGTLLAVVSVLTFYSGNPSSNSAGVKKIL